MTPKHHLPADELANLVRDAAYRTRLLVDDLNDEQWSVPLMDSVNPPGWELGHVAFFYDAFVRGELEGRPPLIENGNELFNSFVIDHGDRWKAWLPDRSGMWRYVDRVRNDVLGRLDGDTAPDARETYLYLLAVYHEDMHGEAFTYTRQTLSYRAPTITNAQPSVAEIDAAGPLPGDVDVPGGRYRLGAMKGSPFVFDNEKWAHPVNVAPFRIARAPVTNTEFAHFVDDGGYRRKDLWGYEGWRWRTRAAAEHPVYWRRANASWLRRHYDSWVPLEPHHPVSHVNWYEAQAWCAWAGRRLPTEAEWELAASGEPARGGRGIRSVKRQYPWGDAPPEPRHANLDGYRLGCADVAAFAGGDSAFGCRQMLGNVWEWTSSPFYPYPGYVLDHPYREYSAPWFGYRKVLRGGAWATRARMIRNTWRNFFTPDRRDIFAGFRTCAG